VTAGTPIAHLSAAGTHCPPRPCLHWGLLKATEYLNPLSLLPSRPIRLLPHSTSAERTARPTPLSAQPPAPAAQSGAPSADPEQAAAQPSAIGAMQPPPTRLRQEPGPAQSGDLLAGGLVVLAAAGTAVGSLLIRRH
jgi:hypothetical protein